MDSSLAQLPVILIKGAGVKGTGYANNFRELIRLKIAPQGLYLLINFSLILGLPAPLFSLLVASYIWGAVCLKIIKKESI